MAVKDMGQMDGEVIEGIQVWKTFRQDAGLPIVRFIHPRSTGLWGALKRADAEIYYQSCAGVATGIVAHFCRKYRRKFIFRIAHDTDCVPGEELIPYWRDRKIYQYGLKNADLVVAQSEQQQILLKRNYAIDSPLVNMVVQLPLADNHDRDIDILWVNNIRSFKRPELLPELARLLPQLKFVMIGGPCHGHEELFSRVRDEADVLANLEFMGFVPYEDVNTYYARARIFVNTSDSEGFPNSFLQAWVRGTPVFSFFDPDNIIKREGLGRAPAGLAEMASSISSMINDEEMLRSLSAHVTKFARDRHSAGSVCDRYQELFDSAAMTVQRSAV